MTREFLGLTQQELARRPGVSQGAVSRLEGARALSTPFLVIVRLNVALARALTALDASMLSEDGRRYLHDMEFLATPPEASETGEFLKLLAALRTEIGDLARTKSDEAHRIAAIARNSTEAATHDQTRSSRFSSISSSMASRPCRPRAAERAR